MSQARRSCEFRFYAELNNFLPPVRRQRALAYRLRGSPTVKAAIEARGVPHGILLRSGRVAQQVEQVLERLDLWETRNLTPERHSRRFRLGGRGLPSRFHQRRPDRRAESGVTTAQAIDLPPMHEPEPVPLPIDGVLDLHTFRPQDVGDLVPTYLAECRKRGILRVRIVHGKGIGALRETVHAVLRRDPGVASFGLAPAELGGWGATVVELSKKLA